MVRAGNDGGLQNRPNQPAFDGSEHQRGGVHCCVRGERMNRTIKEAAVKRYYYYNREQLRGCLNDFIGAYNNARCIKILKDLAPYEYICKIWAEEPKRFPVSPINQGPGINNSGVQLIFRSQPVEVSCKGLSSARLHLSIGQPDANTVCCRVCCP